MTSHFITVEMRNTENFAQFKKVHEGSVVGKFLPHTLSCSVLDHHSPGPHNNHDQRPRVSSTTNFEEGGKKRNRKK